MIDYATTPPYEGEPFSSVELTQDGKRLRRTVIVPPLPLLRVRTIAAEQARAEAEPGPAPANPSAWDSVVQKQLPVIKEAMRRNYPQITDEEVEDIVNVRNCKQMYWAAMGLDQKLLGVADGTQAGEPKPVTVSQ
jgi:hypothetical protein